VKNISAKKNIESYYKQRGNGTRETLELAEGSTPTRQTHYKKRAMNLYKKKKKDYTYL